MHTAAAGRPSTTAMRTPPAPRGATDVLHRPRPGSPSHNPMPQVAVLPGVFAALDIAKGFTLIAGYETLGKGTSVGRPLRRREVKESHTPSGALPAEGSRGFRNGQQRKRSRKVAGPARLGIFTPPRSRAPGQRRGASSETASVWSSPCRVP